MRYTKRAVSFILIVLMLAFTCFGSSFGEQKAFAKTTKASKAVSKVKTAAKNRKLAILSSKTDIVKGEEYVAGKTYSGTAYYISNSGSDENDGLSPSTPFATLEPFCRHEDDSIKLQYGDAIFFERGSIWRSFELPYEVRGVSGITFSAYGEGEKPKFYGSEENGSGAEKWKLFYFESSGKKVWVYHREMTEVAAIVLNGKTPIIRDVAWWNGEKYYKFNKSYSKTTGKVYNVKNHLANMWCFPALEYPENQAADMGDRIFQGWDEEKGESVLYTGALYFRCDAGNPGELYDDIEFIEPHPFIDGCADFSTFDNLNISYSSMTFTTGGSDDHATSDCVLQNLELGWMGGNVTGYAKGGESGDTRVELNMGMYGRNGGAISVNGSNCAIKNNYIHDVFQEGVAIETFVGEKTVSGCIVDGNLIERSTQGILLCNWDTKVVKNHIFENFKIENNIVLYSGVNSFDGNKYNSEYFNSIVLQGGPCANKGLKIRNNTFAYATGALVGIDKWSSKYSKVFSGNTYVQYKKRGKLLYKNSLQKTGLSIGWSPVALTKKNVKKYLGDKSTKLYKYK